MWHWPKNSRRFRQALLTDCEWTSMKWFDSAPSNIALIKYMGKSPGNIPLNSSLSYTLEHLRTMVEIEETNEGIDRWEPLHLSEEQHKHFAEKNCNIISFYSEISTSGQNRFLKHFSFLKNKFRIQKN